jgi:3-oxoacyl-(acyl-carrier-protein) synthase III
MTAVITGLGVSVPSTVVTNADLAQRLDTDDAWIRSRTGIAQRHIAGPELATTDLATEAAARALKSSGSTDADAVVLATMTPDQPCPGSAPQVASRLGLGPAMAFDLNAACSGFLYGLMVSAGLVAAGVAQRVVLVGADIMSRTVDPSDRNTSVLFGDGAGAVVIEAGEPGQPGALGPFDVGGDGDLAGLLMIPAGGSRQPTTQKTVAAGEHALRMDGKEVYRQAVTRMTQSCRASSPPPACRWRPWTTSSGIRPTPASSARSPIAWDRAGQACAQRRPLRQHDRRIHPPCPGRPRVGRCPTRCPRAADRLRGGAVMGCRCPALAGSRLTQPTHKERNHR